MRRSASCVTVCSIRKAALWQARLPRQSIALYYYTATWDSTRAEHGTLFKPRPGSEDHRAGPRSKIDNIAKEVLPPAVYRNSLRVIRRLGI